MKERLDLWLASLELEGEIWLRKLMQEMDGENVPKPQSIPGDEQRQGLDGAGGTDEHAVPDVEEPEPVHQLDQSGAGNQRS